jgi:hypothetical protein
MTAPLDLAATRERLLKARAESEAICIGKRKWTMCVPGRPDDSDIIFADALDAADSLIARCEAAERKCELMRGLPPTPTDWKALVEKLEHAEASAAAMDAILRGAGRVERRGADVSEHEEYRIAVPVEGVWLVREGAYAVVKVEIRGQWYEIIREHAEGNFSHITEPGGIRSAVRAAP